MAEVIDFFSRKRNKVEDKKEDKKEGENKQQTKSSFEEIARKNAENSERVRNERSKKNEKVLRSYRIK